MKIQIKVETQEEVKYPCLMQNKHNSSSVVLFTNKFTGTYVSADDEQEIGYYSSGFNIDNFTIFKGEIILSNH